MSEKERERRETERRWVTTPNTARAGEPIAERRRYAALSESSLQPRRACSTTRVRTRDRPGYRSSGWCPPGGSARRAECVHPRAGRRRATRRITEEREREREVRARASETEGRKERVSERERDRRTSPSARERPCGGYSDVVPAPWERRNVRDPVVTCVLRACVRACVKNREKERSAYTARREKYIEKYIDTYIYRYIHKRAHTRKDWRSAPRTRQTRGETCVCA